MIALVLLVVAALCFLLAAASPYLGRFGDRQ